MLLVSLEEAYLKLPRKSLVNGQMFIKKYCTPYNSKCIEIAQ